ncbi:hypothetical protein ACFFK0_07865 [Paenibacillus chartarius]|uniref:Uncharacterized protein n=1 Tax=Paenibacillus chartarius TaxID=747481 RepID=A0ABV6DI98_9BACL
MDQKIRMDGSEKEPKLVIDGEQYLLHDRCWDIEIVTGKLFSILTFYWKGEVKLSIRYEQKSESLWTKLEAFLLSAYDYLRSASATLSNRYAV